MTEEIKNDYVHCVRCSRSNAIRTLELFGQQIGFKRFNSDHTNMWAKDEDGWHCPKHAHIAMGMDRDEFEKLRDSQDVV